MEPIRQAVERAKGARASNSPQQAQLRSDANTPRVAQSPPAEVMLSGLRLEFKRVVSHDVADPRSRSFDILRTQVLQTMDNKSWQLLGVTSPTPACGKTVVAVNLALSIARQPERSVLLVDMDLQRPNIAATLGLKCKQGLMSALAGRTTLSNSIVQTRIGNQKLLVLPCETSTTSSSEWMASRPMGALLQEIKRDFRSYTVILDLPPILLSDDVISILPQIDSVLFVVAAGTSTTQEIKECNKHLESAEIVRVVLNKSQDATPTDYYSYSRYAPRPKSQTKQSNVPRLKRMSQLFTRRTRS